MDWILKKFKGECFEDRSILDGKMDLFCRLEELKARLSEVIDDEKAHANPVSFSDKDLMFILPQDLDSVRNIKKAIDFAEDELIKKYGIMPDDETEVPLPRGQKNMHREARRWVA